MDEWSSQARAEAEGNGNGVEDQGVYEISDGACVGAM